jgi:hypothetical protein
MLNTESLEKVNQVPSRNGPDVKADRMVAQAYLDGMAGANADHYHMTQDDLWRTIYPKIKQRFPASKWAGAWAYMVDLLERQRVAWDAGRLAAYEN